MAYGRWKLVVVLSSLIVAAEGFAFQPFPPRLGQNREGSLPAGRLTPQSSRKLRRYGALSSNPARIETAAAHRREASRGSAASFATRSGDDGGGGAANRNALSRLVGSRTSRQVRSASLFVALDVAFRCLFQRFQFAFPSSLGGCAALLALLLALPRSAADQLHHQLEPGAALLAKWLPVLFVPSLITLPLADGLSSPVELTKVGLVVAGGFVASLWSTAASVVAVRQWIRDRQGGAGGGSPVIDSIAAVSPSSRFIASADGQVVDEDPVQAMSVRAVQYAEAKQRLGSPGFSRASLRRLAVASAVTGASSLGLLWASSHQTIPQVKLLQGTLTSLSLLSTTLAAFVFGSRLPKAFTKKVHPLVTCTGLTWAAAWGWSQLLGRSFRSVLKRYYRGGHHSTSTWLAAGDVLLFLLGPAVVSLATSMYSRRQLVRDNAVEVGTAVAVSTAGGLLGTSLAVRLLNLGNPFLRLSLLSRNITSPLAMAMAGMLGADTSLAVTMVVVTGLLGANFGAALLDAWKIRDPVARGLAMGAAAHGLGTAALTREADAFPFAALSMALTASAAVSAVSVPVVRMFLLQLALGA